MRSILRTTAAIAPLVMLLSSVPPAAAQPDPGAEADGYFRKGKEAAKNGKLGEALDAYRAAWARKKSSDIACNLGNVEQRSGRSRDAAEHLAYCMRTFPATGSAEQRAAAQKTFDEARAQVGALAIQTSVAGAEILIDGASAGRTPLEDPVFVEAGSHKVDAKLAGYDDAHQDVSVDKGASKSVALTLVVAKGAAGAGAAGGADGAGASAAGGAGGAGGADGGDSKPSGIYAARPYVIGGGIGLLVVGAAVGIGGLVAHSGKADDADALLAKARAEAGTNVNACPAASSCSELRDTLASKDTLQGVYITGFVVGGIGAAAAIVGLVLRKPATSATATTQVVPSLDPRRPGLSVRASF